MGVFALGPILQAIAAALATWNRERALRNSPEMIKNAHDIAVQKVTDAVRNSEAVLADPNAMPEDHKKALDALRLAAS